MIGNANIEYFFKMLFISLFTLKVNYKIIDIKEKNKIINIEIIVCLIIGNIISTIIQYFSNSTVGLIFLIIVITFIFSNKINKNVGYALLITIISISLNYILYTVSVIINYFILRLGGVNNRIIILLVTIMVYSILVELICKIKRIDKGIAFLKKKKNNEYFGMIILNISLILFFSFAILSNIKTSMSVMKTMFIYVLIFSIMMFVIIQKSLQLYYKQKLQEREVEEIKEELKNKDKEIEELEKENLKLSKTNHSIAHKQKSLKYELEQLLLKNEIADENRINEKIESISKEIQKETASIELTKTNIDEIDNMLKYMQSECVKNKIDFQLQVHGNIHHMTNKYITKSDLEILLADHIKNAIIAINHSENINRSILVRLGLIDGFYSVYIYDSGIEFEIETLINLGNKPSTTHADDGGTGMEFINTYDTLRKSKASLIIEEYGKPTKDNFTKLIKVIFDNKNEYKISSYREKEIQEKDKVYD